MYRKRYSKRNGEHEMDAGFLLQNGRAGVRDTICFNLNGKQHVVPLSGKYSATTSLNDYIRVDAGLTGTKVMCREAGCGCCAVAITTEDPLTRKAVTRSINSYMDPYLSVSMSKIALEFSTPVEALEEEFVDLIMRDQISARIDSQNKVLYFKKVDLRSTTFAQTLATGKAYLRKSAALLLRAAVLKNGVNVTAQVNLPNPHKEPPHPLSKFLHDYSHDDDDDN